MDKTFLDYLTDVVVETAFSKLRQPQPEPVDDPPHLRVVKPEADPVEGGS
jgi:hypothetical protein